MNTNKICLVSAALTIALALTGCGKASAPTAPTAPTAPATTTTTAAGAQATPDPTLLTAGNGQNYQTSAALNYVDDGGKAGLLPAGSDVTLLETRNGYRHLGVDSDDASLPSDLWVATADLKAAGLKARPERDLDQADSDPFEDAGRGTSGGMTYCYRYVKDYLLSHHLVKSYLPGASAWDAAPALVKLGWFEVGSPKTAQVDDVCVYHGGRGDNGHVEIRVAGGWYYGYGVKPGPITSVNHVLIGCYRK